MKKSPQSLALALLVSAGAALTVQAQAASSGVRDFDVFVDLPTGFAFVKTPDRWTFVRQLDAEQLKKLHPSTLVELDGARGERLSGLDEPPLGAEQLAGLPLF